MKKTILKGLVAAGFLAAACVPASAGQLSILGRGYGGNTGGGEFLVDLNGDKVAELVTFCLEETEGISGSPFNYTIDAGAIRGGRAGGNPDPLSLAAAWIFEQYCQGTLAASLTGTAKADYLAADNNGKADIVQRALWYLEQEDGFKNSLAQWAEANIAPRNVDNNGQIGVMVINPTDPDFDPITNPNKYYRQSMLICVPDAGLTLGMLGVGLLALGTVRRQVA